VKMFGILVFCLCATTSGVALADCPGSSTPEIDYCLGLEATQLDHDLKRTYDKVVQTLKDAYDVQQNREKLLLSLEKAQQQWLKFRDADCDFVYKTFSGGTGAPIGAVSCRIELTQARIKELKEIIEH